MGTARRGSAAWERAYRTAQRQDGVITRAQWLLAGLDPTQVQRAVGRGHWQWVLPRVYVVHGGPLSAAARCRAALLYAEATPDSAGSGPVGSGVTPAGTARARVPPLLTGRTALVLFGVRYLPADDGLVHLLLPAQVKRASQGFVRVHRTTSMAPTRHRSGFACTPPDRAALLASAEMTSLRDVRALLSEIVQRRLTTVARLADLLEHGPSAGSALARRVIVDLASGCLSAPEMELRDLVLASPVLTEGVCWNHPVVAGGSDYVADACWPALMLIVEVDSVEYHGLGDLPEHTARRRMALTAAGWTVLPVSPRRIRDDPRCLTQELEAVCLRLMRLSSA